MGHEAQYFGSKLGNELFNKNILKLLVLLLITIVLLPRSSDRNKTALYGRKTSALSFDSHRRLFLPGTSLSI